MKNKFLKLDIKYIFPFLFIFFILFNITAEPALATSSSMVEYSFDFSDPDAALSFFQDSPLNEGAVEPPTIELSYTTDTPTNGSVTINADVTDPLGVAETRYATSESKASTGTLFTGSFEVNDNGTYYVYAKDVLGNSTIKSITINNIDKIPPTFETSYNTAITEIMF